MCDYCNFSTTDKDIMLNHEMTEHYHLTPDEYETWRRLYLKRKTSALRYGPNMRIDDELAYHNAASDYHDFVNQHGLTNLKTPSHFNEI